jgi:hypothetical protein
MCVEFEIRWSRGGWIIGICLERANSADLGIAQVCCYDAYAFDRIPKSRRTNIGYTSFAPIVIPYRALCIDID